MKTWIILNDVQIPWQDKLALTTVVDFAKDLRPHGVILNGDIVDCYAISDFDKNPRRVLNWGLDREVKDATTLMNAFADVKRRVWLGGNHEDRWRRIMWRHPALTAMFKKFEEGFKLADYGFEWKPYGAVERLGKLVVTHGSVVRQHSAYSAKAHFDKFGGSVLHGHTHRLGIYYRTNARGGHAGWENGCLCSLHPEYVQFPDWQQGFAVVHVDDNGFFNVQQIPVLKRRTFYYGAMRRDASAPR